MRISDWSSDVCSADLMMAEAIAELAREHGEAGDVEITVAIPGGAELAQRTANGRLGILRGLSVPGTTGIVIPYSCASWKIGRASCRESVCTYVSVSVAAVS